MNPENLARVGLVVGIVALALAASPARAGLDIDFGATIRAGDDTDLYFAISSRYFDRDRKVVENWGARYRHPDDLAVALFISKRSGRSLDAIFSMHRKTGSWWDVSVGVGLPAEVWFLPVSRDPGPPYGKAYGYWKKHRRDQRQAIVLTDPDIRNLMAVRMIHEYYGVPVAVAMEWRSSGRDLRVILSEEYGRRHGKKTKSGKGKPGGPAQAKSRGKGHGKH